MSYFIPVNTVPIEKISSNSKTILPVMNPGSFFQIESGFLDPVRFEIGRLQSLPVYV